MNTRRLSTVNLGALLLGALLMAGGTHHVIAEPWPAWHGPDGTRTAPDGAWPLRWSAAENVRWKTPLPDRGNSSPVVWGRHVFLTQAIEKEGRRTLMAFDRSTGKQLWQSGVTYTDAEETHETNPYCSSTPVTDGERVVAWFGSAGVLCYDFEGRQLWRRDLGRQIHEWGYAASPILYRDLCILNFGPGERSFLIALNKRTGETVWQVDVPPVDPVERTDGFAGRRGGVVGSWSTPIIVQAEGRDELIVSYPGQLRAFDPQTGKDLWSCGGLNPLIYTSPIYGNGVIVAMGGFLGTTIAAKPGGRGDVTESHRLWQAVRTKNRLGSGVVHGAHVYILNTDGIAECLELATGKQIWEERVRGRSARSESWSSMVLAGDRIYIPNQSGETIVLRASPQFAMLSVNPLDGELTNSSPALSNGEIFIRTHKHLWCIGESKSGS